MRLTPHTILRTPVTRPRFGSEIAQLQRGLASWSGSQWTSVVAAVRSNDRVGRGALCNAPCPELGQRMDMEYLAMERGFAVIGLGYVGLPVALALANNFAPVIGFDI